MKKWLMAVLFGTVLVLGACGGGDEDTSGDKDGGSVEAGAAEDTYKKSCASCHGGDLTGGAGPDISKVGDRLSADEIGTVIEEGATGMPGGLVSGDDLTTLADWLAEKK